MFPLAKSKAGRDKNQVFVILNEQDEYVYLVDGKSKTIENPKRKKKKHIQVILETGKQPVSNEEVKYFIKCYKRENQ